MAVENTTNPLVRTAVQVLPVDTTAAAYAYSIGGPYIGANTAVGSVPVSNGQNAVISFIGVGANNSTYTCQVWARTEVSNSQGAVDGAYLLQYVGLATITLSGIIGVTGSTVVPPLMRFADTIVWAPATNATTPAGNYSDIAATLGYTTGTASSAGTADLMVATLTLSTLGQAVELIFDFKMSTATAGNALAQVNVV